MIHTSVIIPAAGTGTRFGSSTPKQFLPLGGIPVIIHTLNVFDQSPDVHSIVLAVHADFKGHMESLCATYGIKKVQTIIEGGKERQHSIVHGLQTEAVQKADIVLVHDAVRPLVNTAFIASVIEGVKEYGAIVPGMPVRETIKEVDEHNVVIKTHERLRLRSIQTPQGFRREILIAAYKEAQTSGFLGTDDASVVEQAGYTVKVIEGLEQNIKITTQSDMAAAELVLQQSVTNLL